MKRRSFLALGVAASALVAAGAIPGTAFAQSAPKTLKLFTTTNLVALDPVISTAEIAVQHGYYVFDTLYGVDNDLVPHPQMAESHTVSDDGLTWTFTIRDGLVFHDGGPVTAADCAASIDRWSQVDGFGRLLNAAVDDYEVIDEKNFSIKLNSPFPRLLEAISKPHSSPCFIMPARLASQPTSEPVTEMVGSGPYRFVAEEFSSGNRVIYEKFVDYKPRTEPANLTSGGKVAKFDRIEWVVNTDSATGVNALLQGEVDVLQYIPVDLMALIEGRDDVKSVAFNGQVPIIRFNSTQAPFNNAELRRIAARAVSQVDILASQVDGIPELYQECKAVFPCGLPGVVENGGDVLDVYAGDYERAKSDLEAAGYQGEKVVILNPTGMASISSMAVITADQLKKAGFNVELQDMDWGTLLERRRSRESTDNGGWSIFCSAWPPISIANPALNVAMRGDGASGYAGWYENAELEAMIGEWLQATSEDDGKYLFERIQALLIEELPTVPLGTYYTAVAFRSDISGLDPAPVIYPWLLDRS
ncbi:ABC transporter substrate-binding protein [Devosia sp. 919]|uniref:ABC transporter substrate-binding protein n=1 Tax=Devosia sp. 919 TaxID=2726065 RepID=UPI001AEEB1C4|nr:ABC transporter substrate-binding protein [Devosia sp. 919]